MGGRARDDFARNCTRNRPPKARTRWQSDNMKNIVEADHQVFSVSDLTRNIRFTLEQQFSGIWIEGEISNFKSHSSGHYYFSLKDEFSQIQCVMFRGENAKLSFRMEEGMKVLCFGRVSVYPLRGQYQLYVERAEPQGVGALQLQFEQLKKKLAEEGLFDEAHKKPIPFLPETIAVVTSIDGAALRDILHVIERRHAGAHVQILPVQVQGKGAAESIAEAIEDLNRWSAADVIIVGRGGGSLEDLWAFNEEIVARAIFNSTVPIISAVGHEVDFTIADFVADLRAATPSAAAEIVLPPKEDLLATIGDFKTRATVALSAQLKNLRQELDHLVDSRALKNPLSFFEIQGQKLEELRKNLLHLWQGQIGIEKEKISGLIHQLEALGPLAILKRGFSMTTSADGKIIKDASALKAGQIFQTRLSKGSIFGVVKEILD